MSKFSYPREDGVDSEDDIEGSLFSSSDLIETFIESDFDEVEPTMAHAEEVGSPLKGR